jgi:hypothetical protein
MSNFNEEKMTEISDFIIRALNLCLANKDKWKNNKEEMIQLMQLDNFDFYEKYPRICRMLIYSNDISPLLNMIKTFGMVQSGKLEFNQANDMITSNLNSTYIDNVLNSEPLVKEREEKMKNEKINIIN